MKFTSPLVPGTLIKRYKRFLADVELEGGEMITAHCANPGAMTGLKEPGSQVWLSESDNPKRKLKYSWELVLAEGHLAGINTAHPNRIVEDTLRAGGIPELSGYTAIRREVKYGQNSRVDLLLERDNGESCYVEVKNVTLKRQKGLAEFPDAVTARGAKHLAELAEMARNGHRAVMFYLVQRQDCDRFTLAGDIDPAYKDAYLDAMAAGVEAICYDCAITTEDISIATALPIEINDTKV